MLEMNASSETTQRGVNHEIPVVPGSRDLMLVDSENLRPARTALRLAVAW